MHRLLILAAFAVLIGACASPTAPTVAPRRGPALSLEAAAAEGITVACQPEGGAFLLRFEGLRGMAPRDTVWIGRVALGDYAVFARLDSLPYVSGGAWSSSYGGPWSSTDTTGAGRAHAYLYPCRILPGSEDEITIGPGDLACTGIEENAAGRSEFFEVRLSWRGETFRPWDGVRDSTRTYFRGKGNARKEIASLTFHHVNADGSVDGAILRPKGGGSVVISRSWYQRGCP